MSPTRVLIKKTGIVCALGQNEAETFAAIERNRSGLRPLSRFATVHVSPLPVGEAPVFPTDEDMPLTHRLAKVAADQAMASCGQAPDAVVLGITTGGMAVTEALLKSGCRTPDKFRFHALESVAMDLAQRYGCKGPLITVSTACSSGTAAVALGTALIRSGRFTRVLAGGVDSLCRLTFYGFKSLQLIDPKGARPLDRDRAGMSVAEGAGMLLLEVGDENAEGIEILGAGLSCDAHHPAQPHPEGRGAFAAMRHAIAEAGLAPHEIDYINLHGTGTIDNDRSEAIAIKTLFGDHPPPLSSIKGATGHSLGAAGAIEAVIAASIIERGLIPGNTGCMIPDASLGITPVMTPTQKIVRTVLSNSFGFGGNNAAIVIGRSTDNRLKALPARDPFTIVDSAILTGAGLSGPSLKKLENCLVCAGKLSENQLCENLPPRQIRRVKRLSQICLALLQEIRGNHSDLVPGAIFLGTGWGCLSETWDFLHNLFNSDEKFSSPTDFIGSVHNAPAGQIALATQTEGPNLTLSGGNYSFEQALFTAQALITDNTRVLVLGADEGHESLSPLFDSSVRSDLPLSDGGGALLLERRSGSSNPTLRLVYYGTAYPHEPEVETMIDELGGPDAVNQHFGLILVGLPAADRSIGNKQLHQFLSLTGFTGKRIDYRLLIGEFATASAVATAWAATLVRTDTGLFPELNHSKAVLVLGLGTSLTAIEVCGS